MSERAFGVLLAALFTAIVVVGIWLCTDWRKCLHTHVEHVHYGSWVQFIPAGKTMIPIIHPAHVSDVDKCDRWEEEQP